MLLYQFLCIFCGMTVENGQVNCKRGQLSRSILQQWLKIQLHSKVSVVEVESRPSSIKLSHWGKLREVVMMFFIVSIGCKSSVFLEMEKIKQQQKKNVLALLNTVLLKWYYAYKYVETQDLQYMSHYIRHIWLKLSSNGVGRISECGDVFFCLSVQYIHHITLSCTYKLQSL